MSVPGFTAECSLYRTSQHYRMGAGAVPMDNGVHLADSCMDDCMAECNGDAATCRFECRAQCGPRPPACQPGYQWCFGTSGHRTCCPESTDCCVHHAWPSLRELLSCCEAGKGCCGRGGCFDPRLQQCTQGGIRDCPSDREFCGGTCCAIGEVCTPQGCTRQNRFVMASAALQESSVRTAGLLSVGSGDARGVLSCRWVTPEGCCPAGRTVCGGKCCEQDWSCTSFQGCCPPGKCCETVPCPRGRDCCGKILLPARQRMPAGA